MNALLSKLGVAAFSFLIGALLTRWWDRARPLVVLQGFSTFREPSREVEYPPQLQQLTGDSWFSNRFPPGKVRFEQIESVFSEAKTRAPLLEDATEKATSWHGRLEKAREDEEVKIVLQEFISHEGMNWALDSAIMFEELSVDKLEPKPEKPESEQPPLEIAESNEYGGLYMIPWTKSPTYFGHSLNLFPFLKQRYKPFIDAMQYLDRALLAKTVKEMVPLIERQIRILHHIHEMSEDIVDKYTQWAARILVQNYGASPMVISPEVILLVKGGEIRKEGISADCNLYFERADPSKLEKLEGLHILGPGEKTFFWAITTKPKMSIPEGEMINGLYKKEGAAKACVKLSIFRKGTWKKSSISSNDTFFSSTFRENLVFPKTSEGS